MGLLSRLRAWIGGSTSDGESAASEADAESAAEDDTAERDESDPTGLDPSAATETRTAATDDAVDALRDVRRSSQAAPDGESADGPTEHPPDETVDSDRDAP